MDIVVIKNGEPEIPEGTRYYPELALEVPVSSHEPKNEPPPKILDEELMRIIRSNE